MSEGASKSFDCVNVMREIRDRLSREIENMDYEELTKWLRSHEYADPKLKCLARLVEAGRADS